MVLTIICICAAYLLGSISTAVLTCRLLGLPDPRTEGSNNPGATNVLRIGGKKAAIITLLGDVLKGFIPVYLANLLLPVEPITLGWIALAAVLGHLYPIFFKFEGGKGIGTTLGAYLGISWLLGGVTLATWLFMAMVFRISSLASLTLAIATPIYTWLFFPSCLVPAAIISVFLIWRHRDNIKRLLAGEESKIGKKA